ncbi:RapZ C-terminal domain-containing protein [Amycolatopsis japonica]|uniref:RapZ C-terminal domain-containing protein n=1 Tax=Amycolatopsis japonica TaxID=208439 RepID=UPI0033C18B8A
MSPRLDVASFGYGHDDTPAADITIDVRQRFRDPHTSPALQALTGKHPDVYLKVAAYPGVRELVTHTYRMVLTLAGLGPAPVTVAFGCVGGRHRSVVLADMLYRRAHGTRLPGGVILRTSVRHCHIDLPVLARQGETSTGDSGIDTVIGEEC